MGDNDTSIADQIAKDDNARPVFVRVAEWTEWIPGEVVKLGEREDPKRPGRMLDQRMAIHEGMTMVTADKREKLIELSVTQTGLQEGIVSEEEGGDPVVYSCYAFQATFARDDVTEGLANELLAAQRAPLEEARRQSKEASRDKRGDLAIVENGVTRPNKVPKAKQRPRR